MSRQAHPHAPAGASLLTLLVVLSACPGDEVVETEAARAPIPAAEGRVAVENGLLPRLPIAGRPPWRLADRMAAHEVPGLSLAVIDDFALEWEHGYGTAVLETGAAVTTGTAFQAASISKTVTAVTAVALAERGAFDLDAPINGLLTTWRLPASELDPGSRGVTLRTLLDHSAGLGLGGFDGYSHGEPVPTVVQALDGLPPANHEAIRRVRPPGEDSRYSGGGYLVVQQAIADALGKPFAEVVRETLFEPLGMNDSFYPPEERSREIAHGYYELDNPVPGGFQRYVGMGPTSLWTTAGDLARLGVEILQAGRGRGRVLSRAAVEALSTPAFGDFGLGLFFDERPPGQVYWQHSGSNRGYRALLLLHPKLGHGIAAMANGSGGGHLLGELWRAAARVYGWPRDPVPIEELPPADPLPDVRAGFFIHEAFQLELASVVGEVELRSTIGGDWRPLVATGAGAWVEPEWGWRLEPTIVPEPDGSGAHRLERLKIRFYSGWEEELEPFDPAAPPGVAQLVWGDFEAGTEAVRESGWSSDEMLAVGWELVADRRRAAQRILELNVEAHPGDPKAYFELAELYWFDQQPEKALETHRALLAALEANPGPDSALARRMRHRSETWVQLLSDPGFVSRRRPP